MASLSQSLALGSEYSSGGKTYRLAPCTFEIQGLFENYLERQDLEAYSRLKGRLDREDREIMLAAIQHKAALRTWTFGAKAAKDALDQKPHLEYMIFLMLSKNHQELALDDVRKMFEADAEGLMRAANRANADPNGETPGTPGSPIT